MRNSNICSEIISHFERNPSLQRPGKTRAGLFPQLKQSTDMTIHPKELEISTHAIFGAYMNELRDCFLDYSKQWPFLGSMLKAVDIGSFNIQRYTVGEHYMSVHSERITMSTSHRVLAWMTYLNDVEDGGQTNFPHYDLDVKPECGKTLIWPAEWTHAHSAKIVNSGTKYIITGWMHFPPLLGETGDKADGVIGRTVL